MGYKTLKELFIKSGIGAKAAADSLERMDKAPKPTESTVHRSLNPYCNFAGGKLQTRDEIDKIIRKRAACVYITRVQRPNAKFYVQSGKIILSRAYIVVVVTEDGQFHSSRIPMRSFYADRRTVDRIRKHVFFPFRIDKCTAVIMDKDTMKKNDLMYVLFNLVQTCCRFTIRFVSSNDIFRVVARNKLKYKIINSKGDIAKRDIKTFKGITLYYVIKTIHEMDMLDYISEEAYIKIMAMNDLYKYAYLKCIIIPIFFECMIIKYISNVKIGMTSKKYDISNLWFLKDIDVGNAYNNNKDLNSEGTNNEEK